MKGMQWCHFKDINIFGMDHDKQNLKKILYWTTKAL